MSSGQNSLRCGSAGSGREWSKPGTDECVRAYTFKKLLAYGYLLT